MVQLCFTVCRGELAQPKTIYGESRGHKDQPAPSKPERPPHLAPYYHGRRCSPSSHACFRSCSTVFRLWCYIFWVLWLSQPSVSHMRKRMLRDNTEVPSGTETGTETTMTMTTTTTEIAPLPRPQEVMEQQRRQALRTLAWVSLDRAVHYCPKAQVCRVGTHNVASARQELRA